jgi:hypothetical protein
MLNVVDDSRPDGIVSAVLLQYTTDFLYFVGLVQHHNQLLTQTIYFTELYRDNRGRYQFYDNAYGPSEGPEKIHQKAV